MNLTLSIDERVVRRARKVAAAMHKSLNQLIREHLEQITSSASSREFSKELRRLSAEAQGDSGGRRFTRDEAHART
jgi:hypothetical protein